MRKRSIAALLAAGAAGVAAAVAVGSAGAANTVTLGSTSGDPMGNICVATINCTYVPFSNAAAPELQVPFDGTVTSFSINSNSSSGSVKLRVLRPSGGGQFTGVGTSTAEPLASGLNTFTVSLPVKAGDVIGLDNDSSALLFDVTNSTPLTAYYEVPSLADGATAPPNHTQMGYRLLLSATVTASTSTTTTGTTGTTNTTTSTNPPTPPQLTNVKQSHRRWREGTKLAKFASGTAPVGTTFRFSLSEAARVRFAFKQQRCGHRCAKGTLTHSLSAGAHKLSFQGRISRRKRLPHGRYKLTITATSAAGLRSNASTLSFTIVPG
jgi:hypothetical protein